MDKFPITRKGYEKLEQEIKQLKHVERPAVIEAISTAREFGDLSENAEYHAARETQGYTQAKINQLKTKLSHCHIVERTDGPKDTVAFGAIVKVKDLSDDMEETYELVGPGEEDYDGDVMKILTTSPIASALIGRKVGDKVEVEIPRGVLRMEILGIE